MKAGARPRRGAPPKGEASARERILATATSCFTAREFARLALTRSLSDPVCRKRPSIGCLNRRTP